MYAHLSDHLVVRERVGAVGPRQHGPGSPPPARRAPPGRLSAGRSPGHTSAGATRLLAGATPCPDPVIKFVNKFQLYNVVLSCIKDTTYVFAISM